MPTCNTPRMRSALLLALILIGTAHADVSKTVVACQACHFSDSAPGPHLVGQREKYLAKQLAELKSGDRKNDFMTAIAKQLSDADIAELAAYWSKQPVGSDATVPAAAAALAKSRMTFPTDFPKGFVVYHSETDDKHVTARSYANAIAVAAAKAGKPMPNGSVIIVGNYGADDKPISFSGMEIRAGWGKNVPAIVQNGDWSYGLWTAERAAKDVNQVMCLACHKPAATTSYVFGYDKIKTGK